jgi:hypothetical protein
LCPHGCIEDLEETPEEVAINGDLLGKVVQICISTDDQVQHHSLLHLTGCGRKGSKGRERLR